MRGGEAAVPQQPIIEVHRAEWTCCTCRIPCWSRGMAKELEIHARICSWSDLCLHGDGILCLSSFAGHKICNLGERTRTGVDNKEMKPVGRTHTGENWGRLLPTGEIPHWTSGRVWGGKSGRDKVQWTAWNIPSCTTGKEEVENLGIELRLERRKQWAGDVFKIYFYFSLSYLLWLVIN